MKTTYRFVYKMYTDEQPDAVYVQANNITNARMQWDACRTKEHELLAIFAGDQELWRSEVETGYKLEAIR